jgi:NAD(P)H dehydrogenase (quinone)
VRGGYSREDAVRQEQYLNEQLREHRARFATVDTIPTVPFNTAEDWDGSRKLKPHAPVHSPFIRHQAAWWG